MTFTTRRRETAGREGVRGYGRARGYGGVCVGGDAGRRVGPLALTSVLALALSACTAPPAVGPLLRAVDQALAAEAGQLAADAARDTQQLDEQRRALAAGFDADLAQRPGLDTAWIKDAAEGYAAAREALAEHAAALRAQRAQRAANLAAARAAQRRALRLLERQDQLITSTLGLEVWRWAPVTRAPE